MTPTATATDEHVSTPPPETIVRPASRMRPWLVSTGKALTGLVALVLLYTLARQLGWLPPNSTASVTDIAVSMWEGLTGGAMGLAALQTLQAWLVGMVIATVAGVVLGIMSGLWWPVDGALKTSIEFIRPIPSVALIPLAITLFGLALPMQVFLVALPCTWPIFIASRHAVRGIDPLWRDVATISGLSRSDVIGRVITPAVVPGVITGIRTASSIAIIVAVAAELVSGSPGLGSYLSQAQSAGNVGSAFAATILAGLIGLVLDGGLRLAERFFAGWQEKSTEANR